MELNYIISGFVIEKNYIEFIFLQFFPSIYPFRRPFYEILKFNSNSVDIEEIYLKKKIKLHEKKEWNANILMDKDILDLLVDLDLYYNI